MYEFFKTKHLSNNTLLIDFFGMEDKSRAEYIHITSALIEDSVINEIVHNKYNNVMIDIRKLDVLASACISFLVKIYSAMDAFFEEYEVTIIGHEYINRKIDRILDLEDTFVNINLTAG